VEAIRDEATGMKKRLRAAAFGRPRRLRNCIEAGVDYHRNTPSNGRRYGLIFAKKRKGILETDGVSLRSTRHGERAKSTGGKYSCEAMREKRGSLAIARGLKISFGSESVGPFHTEAKRKTLAYLVNTA